MAVAFFPPERLHMCCFVSSNRYLSLHNPIIWHTTNICLYNRFRKKYVQKYKKSDLIILKRHVPFFYKHMLYFNLVYLKPLSTHQYAIILKRKAQVCVLWLGLGIHGRHCPNMGSSCVHHARNCTVYTILYYTYIAIPVYMMRGSCE